MWYNAQWLTVWRCPLRNAAIVGLLVVLAATQAAQANYIYGTIVDHEGNPIEGIPVSFLGSEGITDANGFYVTGDAAGIVPQEGVPWGSIKARFSERQETPLPRPQFRAALAETTDTLYINLGASRDTTYWSAKCVVTCGGELELNGALPPFVVTIPNGPDLSGPMQARVTPDHFKDCWDVFPNGIGYSQFTSWDPRAFPVETFANDESISHEVWDACVVVMNDWELMTGWDFYNILPWQEYPTGDNYIMFMNGDPSVNRWVSSGWVYQGKVFMNTTYPHKINHEAGWRILTGNISCHVTTWYPSNFQTCPGNIVPRDIAVVKVSYDLKQRYADGENDIQDTEYLLAE
jgi:hypothetical protein